MPADANHTGDIFGGWIMAQVDLAGAVPAILTAMIMSMFPIVVNVATGLATTEPELEDVMKTLRASKLDILWNVGLPRAMPYFFASSAAVLAFLLAMAWMMTSG